MKVDELLRMECFKEINKSMHGVKIDDKIAAAAKLEAYIRGKRDDDGSN